jgi:hypothetical protein
MEYTYTNQAKRAGIALAAVAAFTALGTGAAQAAVFTSADLSIAARSNEAQEVTAGDLTCTWREAELGPFAQVEYACAAQAVAVVEACVYKNQIISATQTSVFTNVTGEHEAVFLAGNNGRINGTLYTSPGHGGGGEQLCPHIEVPGGEATQPEVEVVAVRWCNASLTDTTNNIVGATAAELLGVLQKGAYDVPTCAEILPATP